MQNIKVASSVVCSFWGEWLEMFRTELARELTVKWCRQLGTSSSVCSLALFRVRIRVFVLYGYMPYDNDTKKKINNAAF